MLCSGRMDGFMDKWNGGGGVLCNSLSVHSQKKKKKKEAACVFARQSSFGLFAKGGRLV